MSIAKTSTRSNGAVGEVHTFRISMTELFKGESNFDSSTSNQSNSSSSSSSSSSSFRSRDRPKKRPCVIWRINPDLQVLVLSRFDGVDVSDSNVRLFNHLPQEYVLKKLVAVYPKAPFGGRRSIAAATRSPSSPMKTMNTNLILAPVSIEEPLHWKVAVEYFPAHELEYIAESIFQLAEEERARQLKMIKQLNPQPLIDDKEVTEQQDDNSSSSSSLPKRRSESIHIEWRKDDFINTWLNDSFSKMSEHEKSSENDIELALDCLSAGSHHASIEQASNIGT